MANEIESISSKNEFPPLFVLAGQFCDCGNSMLRIKKIKENVKYFYCRKCDNYYDRQGKKFSSRYEFEKYYEKELVREKTKKKQEEQEEYKNNPFNPDTTRKLSQEGISYIRYYYAKTKCHSVEQIQLHEFMISVKRDRLFAQNHITPILKKLLKKDVRFVICVIPSSEEGLIDSSIRSIAKDLCVNNIVDGTSCLVRKYTIPKKHLGGDRDINKEINSLELKDKEIIKDQLILLIDDITTTGTSLNAGIDILKMGGARKVVALALAKTV